MRRPGAGRGGQGDGEGGPAAGRAEPDDNRRDTIVTVIKGGVNVLLIDKERAWEPQLIYDALARDPRISVKPLWLRGSAPIAGDAGKLFDFDKQKYDVIIVGDVTAAQLRALQPDVLEQIPRQVDRGAGFLMIGGYASFGGDPDGAERRGRRLEGHGHRADAAGGPERQGPGGEPDPAVWDRDAPDGGRAAALQPRRRPVGRRQGCGDSRVEKYAKPVRPARCQSAGGRRGEQRGRPGPIGGDGPANESALSAAGGARDYGDGRVLAFAGDTTNRWIHDRDSKRKHDRFWRQMVLWLARQDEGEDQLRVEPDVRSIAAGNDLGFSLHLRSKNGQDVKDADYEIEVIGPNGEHKTVTPTKDGGEDRGVFRPEAAGEYTIHAKGRGKDADGADVHAEGSARFFAYEEEVEMAEWAADEDFLKKLADEGRGEYHRGTQAGVVPGAAAAAARAEDEAEGGRGAGLELGVVVAVFRAVLPAVHGAAGRGVVPAAAWGMV